MTKNEIILDIKDCIDNTYGCDCAYYDVDGFAIANEIYKRGYRKVERGEWIGRKGRDYYTCSICCCVTKNNEDEFCRHCGADMRKEGAENG